jgi:SsrA-binding protein
MAKKARQPKKITNRRARFDYELGDDLVVGLALSGAETKALRHGHGQLAGAFINIKDDELWLVGALINSTNSINISPDEQTRSRKLLAKRREIEALAAARQQGKAIVPLEMLTGGRYIKLRIAVGKGRKRYDKRETIKRRQQEREASRLANR